MKRMTKQNLKNIRLRFQEKTGTNLDRQPYPVPMRRMLVLVAAVLCCLAMVAFSYPLFSGLDGDELSLSGTYEGKGIVSVHVENRSDKWLRFQEQTKLMRWVTSEEVKRLEGKAIFDNTEFAPHSDGIMSIDLSGAYDIRALEDSPTKGEWYYLVLTNNNFLFGQDWMCSVNFTTEAGKQEETIPEETTPSVTVDPETASRIDEELRFYFEESYVGTLMAFNEANFQYQQKVDEMLTRFEGTVIPALGPVFMVGGPSEFLDPEPVLGKVPEGVIFDTSIPMQQQYLLTQSDWTYTDAYGRMVATADEKAWVQTAILPQYPGQTDGGVEFPLVFLFVYDAKQVKPEYYAFIYGQVHSFGELEKYKVLEDEHYVIYDATDLIYTDVDVYLDDFLAARKDVFCDAQIRKRVSRIYDFYRDKDNLQELYGYLTDPET